jgi:hypothetical protein
MPCLGNIGLTPSPVSISTVKIKKEELNMKKQADVKESLSLKELIRRVQEELAESQEEREKRGDQALFEVEKLVLEVNFAVTRSAKVNGRLEFKVLTLGGVNAGGGHDYEQQRVHKITLSLKAVPPAPGHPGIGFNPLTPHIL